MTRRNMFELLVGIPLIGVLFKTRNKQRCQKGHSYIANSHEYPCPYCEKEHLEYALSHANGALGDIRTIVTDCIGADDPQRLHEICEVVLQRVLTSDSQYHNLPSWYRHAWEQQLFEKYAAGKLEPCGGGKRHYKIC